MFILLPPIEHNAFAEGTTIFVKSVTLFPKEHFTNNPSVLGDAWGDSCLGDICDYDNAVFTKIQFLSSLKQFSPNKAEQFTHSVSGCAGNITYNLPVLCFKESLP